MTLPLFPHDVQEAPLHQQLSKFHQAHSQESDRHGLLRSILADDMKAGSLYTPQ